MRLSWGTGFAIGGTVVVVLAVVAGLRVIGPPTEERARRTDERRVRDLQEIRTAANLYWTRHARLPASLDELASEPGVRISSLDPRGGEAYSYQPVDSVRFEVCATFERETEALSSNPVQDLWAHGRGRQCFEVDAEGLQDEAR